MSKATKHFLRQFTIWTVNAVFIFWILPLGVFIKASQEQKACNGRRAICLCTNLLGKALAKRKSHQAITQTGTAPQKENAAASKDYVLAEKEAAPSSGMRSFIAAEKLSYSFQFVRSIDAVPKAESFSA